MQFECRFKFGSAPPPPQVRTAVLLTLVMNLVSLEILADRMGKTLHGDDETLYSFLWSVKSSFLSLTAAESDCEVAMTGICLLYKSETEMQQTL